MKRTFNETMRRADMRAKGFDPDTANKLITTHNPNNLKKHDITHPDKTNKNYNGLYLTLHTDKAFLLAQSWGMEPGLLYNLCRDYGLYFVRSTIYKVNGIGPRYFRESEAIEPQRGKYCRALILKGKINDTLLKHNI